MVKAAVRSLDTVESFIAKGIDGYKATISKWTVCGASKRGWTTWLVAAVIPDRVYGFVPAVLDLLNF